jgi:biofilm PGA synthesis protein PgaD
VRAVDAVRHTRGGVSRGVFGTVTLGAWTLYAYLWLPAITLVAWAAGLRTAWVQSVLESASVDVDALWLMAALVVLLGCTLVLWAEQQRKRFTGLDRRHRADDVAPLAVAVSLGVAPEVLNGLQVARVATVHLDGDGRPVRVVTAAPVVAGAPAVPGQRRPAEDLTPRG